MKSIYWSIGKPLKHAVFEQNSPNRPMGWIRHDYILAMLKDKEFRKKFTQEEIKTIKSIPMEVYR